MMANQFILAGALDLALGLWILVFFLGLIDLHYFREPDDHGSQANHRSGKYRGLGYLRSFRPRRSLSSVRCGATYRSASAAGRQFLGTFDVGGGQHALHFDNLAHFLSLYVFKFSPSDFVPSYWIDMGAMAISTLAGSVLIQNATDAWFLEELLPVLKGFTISFWAAGTGWIPLLIILVGWRHIVGVSPSSTTRRIGARFFRWECTRSALTRWRVLCDWTSYGQLRMCSSMWLCWLGRQLSSGSVSRAQLSLRAM